MPKNSEQIKPANPDDKKLNIVCLGAIPAIPEFGAAELCDVSDADISNFYTHQARRAIPEKTYAEMANCVPKTQKLLQNF